MKIALFAPNWIGDMVMSHSLIQVIRERYPHAQLDVYAPEPAVQIAQLMPEVHHAIPLPFVHGKLDWRKRRAFARGMGTYDTAFVLPNSLKSALLPWLSGVAVRVGWLGEWRYGLLTHTQRLPKDILTLHAARYQALIELLDAPASNNNTQLAQRWHTHAEPRRPKLHVVEQLQQQVRHLLPKKPFVALCPSAAFGSAKCWPSAHFATLADMLITQLDMAVVFVGSASDSVLIKTIIEQSQHQDQLYFLAGKINLVQASAVLSLAAASVCNDSGLMHIAAAIDAPLVALYGPTSAVHTPPLAVRFALVEKQLDCRPCYQRSCPLAHHKCMQEITPNEVHRTLVNLLQHV